LSILLAIGIGMTVGAVAGACLTLAIVVDIATGRRR
jgi:hypothetical protein